MLTMFQQFWKGWKWTLWAICSAFRVVSDAPSASKGLHSHSCSVWMALNHRHLFVRRINYSNIFTPWRGTISSNLWFQDMPTCWQVEAWKAPRTLQPPCILYSWTLSPVSSLQSYPLSYCPPTKHHNGLVHEQSGRNQNNNATCLRKCRQEAKVQ